MHSHMTLHATSMPCDPIHQLRCFFQNKKQRTIHLLLLFWSGLMETWLVFACLSMDIIIVSGLDNVMLTLSLALVVGSYNIDIICDDAAQNLQTWPWQYSRPQDTHTVAIVTILYTVYINFIEEGARRKPPKKVGTLPRHKQEPSHHTSADHNGTSRLGTTEGTRRTPAQLAPLRPSGAKKLPRSHYSVPSELNSLRQELNTHLGHHNRVTEAWHSNPASHNASLQPSQHGSRISSQHSSRISSQHSSRLSSGVTRPHAMGVYHARASSYHEEGNEMDDLTFHEVGSYSLPRPSKKRFTVSPTESSSSILPSITSTGRVTKEKTRNTSGWQRTHLEKPKNGYPSPCGIDYKAETELDVDEVVKEIQRVAQSLKIRDVERKGLRNVLCTWNGVKIQISVSKELGECTLTFLWISGGDLVSYKDKREKIVKRVKL